ncbi:hypothetical protein D1B33_17120 [Lysinibacillus yapensis]|uniref:DUF2238 domain-containing protein n=1 Tax=Ureibacillus yapensis TaxID=2304605 RepID=A0A396S2Y4_9BACL|nr:hypothetical protein [Lysinibacillus yapensis]RHW32062.1 hypothetical protein D1B33_17120 [Lysinibacillus yapensis]
MIKNKKKKMNWKKIMEAFLLITLILSIIYIIFKIIYAPTDAESSDTYTKVKSDYTLMLIQCVLGIVIMRIPAIIERTKTIDIPDIMELLYFVFLYCAIYLGEVQNFYYLIPFWDNILHAFSGAMLGVLGFMIVNYLNEAEGWKIELNPFFVSFFAFCFALTCGTVWEIYEFLCDGLLKTNMQKFALADETLLIGRDAVYDTMMDLIIDGLSAFVISTIGFFKLRKEGK